MIDLRLILYLFIFSLLFPKSGLFFHKITDEEKSIYCNKSNFTDHKSTISNLFHYSSQYEFFEYSDKNQFEARRKKQEHSKFLSDQSYYSTLISEFNYKKDFYASWVLSDFDFDNNLYYINVKKILNYIVSPISNEIEIVNPIEGFNNVYYTDVFFDNYPDKLALKIPNLNDAEEFSKKSVTLRVNFKILPKIVRKNKYDKRDISTTFFDQWLRKAEYEGSNFKGMENEEVVKYFLYHIYQLSHGRQHIIDLYGTAFNRNYYIEFHCELESVELLSSVVGTHIWIPN